MQTKISHAGLTKQFFKIGTQNTDIPVAIIKKVPFFKKKKKKKTVILTPFSRPAWDAAYTKKGHPFTAKFWSMMTT